MEVQMTEQLYWIIFEVPSNYWYSTQPRVGSLKFALDYLVNEFNVLIKIDHDIKFLFS